MEFSANQISQLLGGTIDGDGNRTVSNVSGIETAKEGDLCFLGDAKYIQFLADTKASIVLLSRNIAFEGKTDATIIRVDNARGAMAMLLSEVAKVLNPARKGVEQGAYVSEGVEVPEGAYIGAGAYIGRGVRLGRGVQIYPQTYIGDNTSIGDRTVLYAGVKVYYGCNIGQDCIVHSGAVIGSDGFGFEPDEKGVYHKVPQIGTVVIEDDVEIGANTTIDRAMMGETRIGRNTKIDNLCQIAHNVQIGESTVLCGQVGIAGSTKIGSHCTLTGQVGVAGHIEIADGCMFGAKSGVAGSIRKAGQYIGMPAIEANRWRRAQAVYRRLPDIYRKLQ
ncbi:MAG: UDP-3-O-(3-hydroxymyristoyl)glucosamine N-acyltransferase [Paludibacteraceae bacterium]|nr:UDP-3-O-(3-hydroxymyristoyl)glucosamine N-acyltransferase [Paludibacteraceae bacterium]